MLSSGFAGDRKPKAQLLQARSSARPAHDKGHPIHRAQLGRAWPICTNGVIPSISQVFDQTGLEPGAVGFVTQSGAVGTAITALAHAEGIGIGYFLSTGNEGDLEFSDFCDYFSDDPQVRIIAGYLESIRDGDEVSRRGAQGAARRQADRSDQGRREDAGGRAVRSHTGALAGSEEVYRAAFDDARDHSRATSIEESDRRAEGYSLAYPAGRRPRRAAGARSRS